MSNQSAYAVLITSQPDENNVLRQNLIVALATDDVRVWSRTTNGGRGEANAWYATTWNDLLLHTNGNEPIFGDVLSSPLTSIDEAELQSNTRPEILTQKLTKQFKLRKQVVSNQLLADVVDDVRSFIESDNIIGISKYRSDGRTDKSTVNTPIANSIPATIVRVPVATPTPIVTTHVATEVVGDYVATIPTADEVSGYITRTFAGGINEVTLYDHCIAKKENISLEGEAGTGKTSSAKHYAYLRQLPFYSFSASVGAEYSQLFGKIKIDKETGQPVWQDGVITQMWKTGGVLLIDEGNFLPPKVASALHNSLDDNRVLALLDSGGEVITAHPNLLVILSWNAGYRGTNHMNEAFIDRFAHKRKFEYDTKIEAKFIPSKSLLELFSAMRADAIGGLYETPLSTRLLKKFVSNAKSLSYDYAVDNLLNAFTADERSSVALLFEAKRYNIMKELGFEVETIVVEQPDEATYSTTSA